MSSIGPALPPHLRNQQNQPDDDDEDEERNNSNEKESPNDNNSYGPSLPPGFLKQQEDKKKTVGPTLPPHLMKERDGTEDNSYNKREDEEEEEEDEFVGPCLPGTNADSMTDEERIKKEFEDRAKAMKSKLTGEYDKDKKMERENWMLELPPEISKNFGLGPRTFRAKAPELGDRSVWTDTPADKERKLKERREDAEKGQKRKQVEVKQPTAEELEMHKRVEDYNKATRPQSLMEMHQEKRKKENLFYSGLFNEQIHVTFLKKNLRDINNIKVQTGETSSVRRPFDRERDLSINRANPKEREKFIQQAQGLNTKFSKSSYTNKFL